VPDAHACESGFGQSPYAVLEFEPAVLHGAARQYSRDCPIRRDQLDWFSRHLEIVDDLACRYQAATEKTETND
jgi:hypothetical protein